MRILMLLVITLVAMSSYSCSGSESVNVNRRAETETGVTVLANMMSSQISDLYHKGDTVWINVSNNVICRTCVDDSGSAFRKVVLKD